MPVREPHALGDVMPHVPARGARRRPRLVDLDARLQDGGDRVDDDLESEEDRRPEEGEQHAAQRRPGGLGDGLTLTEPRVGGHERPPRDDARQQWMRRGIGEQRENPEHEDDGRERPEVQGVQEQQHGDRGEGHRAPDRGEHERALAAPTIHQRADDQPQEEVGHDAERAQDADLHRGRIHDRHDQHLERDARDRTAEGADRRRAPEVGERRVAEDVARAHRTLDSGRSVRPGIPSSRGRLASARAMPRGTALSCDDVIARLYRRVRAGLRPRCTTGISRSSAPRHPLAAPATRRHDGTMAHPKMFKDDDPYLARVRKVAMEFPEASERVSHGRPNFYTTKTFCYYGGSVHDDEGWVAHDHAILVRPDPDDEPALRADERFWVPGYLGPAGWLGLDLDGDTDWAEITELIDASYRVTAPARLVRSLPPLD